MNDRDSIFGLRLTHGELEQEPNAFFVRFRPVFWDYLAHEHTKCSLYVPDRFAWQGFGAAVKGLIILRNRNLTFTDSPDKLIEYEENITNGKWTAHKHLYLPDTVIDTLEEEGREYNQLVQRLTQIRTRTSEVAGSLDNYIIDVEK